MFLKPDCKPAINLPHSRGKAFLSYFYALHFSLRFLEVINNHKPENKIQEAAFAGKEANESPERGFPFPYLLLRAATPTVLLGVDMLAT